VKSIALLFLACLTLPIAALSARPSPAHAGSGAPAPAPATGIAWRGWDRGIEESRATGRPVLVDVYTDWCGWCKRMKADVYTKPEVRDYLEDHFVMIELNAESSDPARYEGKAYTSRSLAARFGVSGYPTTVFLRAGGDHLVSVPGYLESARFLQVLRFIGDGYMEKGVSFQDFTKQSAPAAPHR
jgi:thioredoxin-related protein